MRSSQCFLIVFSIIDRKSFEEVDEYIDQILRVKDSVEGEIPMMIVGNKIDLESERVISFEEAKNYANDKKVGYMECSARKRQNIDECFYELVKSSRSLNKKQELPIRQNPRKRMCNIM